MGGLYQGNDLTNAQKKYPEARHISLQSNTHKHVLIIIEFLAYRPRLPHFGIQLYPFYTCEWMVLVASTNGVSIVIYHLQAGKLHILTLPEKVADTEITKAADVDTTIVNHCASVVNGCT